MAFTTLEEILGHSVPRLVRFRVSVSSFYSSLALRFEAGSLSSVGFLASPAQDLDEDDRSYQNGRRWELRRSPGTTRSRPRNRSLSRPVGPASDFDGNGPG